MKRRVLENLTRQELQEAVDRCDIQVTDRRVKEQLVEALVRYRRTPLADVLEGLSRDRLKEVCRALGLDDSGREKAVLIERLTGQPSVSASEASAASIPTRPAPTPAPRKRNGNGPELEAPAGVVLTVDQLERYLWSAADILRGSIDSSDYKSYIFGLVFLKRLSDRFDEECDAVLADGGNPEDPDEHQFFVPKAARWSTIQKASTEIGEVLNKACAALENANERTLEGVLGGMDYNDERKLGDARQRDTVLARLVQHFSRLTLRNSNLSEPDMLGRAYEYLIEKFADDAGKKGGEFYTPRKVVQLIVELLAPKEGMRICDPTVGSGGMLIECAHYVERQGGNPKNLSLFGQEKNLGTWAICKMNMLLHGLPDARIEKGDTIRDPKLVQDGALMVFDRVIANPPFSLDEWGREVAENDPYGRFRYGIPPKTKGDLAFVQHMVAVLNKHGQLGVVMPHGVLFRGSSEGEIRKGILKDDLIEAVIGLPTNLFYGTGIPAAILVLNRDKKIDRRRKVLFIHAAREFQEGSAQNYLRDQDVEKISKTFH
ncbi:MAG: N-6 DNA methylase, partial [Thermoanaerobaculia bacterium]|nr:N-6 DNA methylase [Thermoanaerobaculia bacterium]